MRLSPKLVVSVFIALGSQYALAADTFSWQGGYVGLHTGYSVRTSTWNNLYGTYEGGPDDVVSQELSNYKARNTVSGITAGYNFQMSPSLILGLEGSFSGGGSGQSSCLGDQGYSATCSSKANWVGDLSARAGIPVNKTLFFAKGGIAFGSFDYNVGNFVGFTDPPYNTVTKSRTGWLFGLGVEQALTNSLTAKFEANYANYGTSRANFTSSSCYDCYNADFGTDIKEKMVGFKVGLNMKF